LNIGDTFLLCDPRVDEHLWVVISHPGENADEVVIVNLTGFERFKTVDCILELGDHPYITKKSCIAYEHSKCVRECDLDSFVQNGMLKPLESGDNGFLCKILEGANITDAMPNKCKRVLAQQNLIDS
jgi:hypothetical protein